MSVEAVEITFVRRENAAKDLVYHRSECRYVADKDDVVEVPRDEVEAAWAATLTDEGTWRPVWVAAGRRRLRLNVCTTCLKIDMTRTVIAWPPQ